MPASVETLRESEKYFKQLSPYFQEIDMEEIRTGYAFSKYGHRNQERRTGERYFDHPKAVSLIIFNEFEIRFDWRVMVIALLHDIIEDQYLLTERRIKINFGKLVAEGVKFMSKDEDSRPIFYERLFTCFQWRPVIGKLADRIHNLRTLGESSPATKRKQVEETEKYFFKLCDVALKISPTRHKKAIAYARTELNKLCEIHKPAYTHLL
jgi:guanosine-3',5'-bis(diphosphate) 3'-pyrophosphohydrolase